MTSTRLCKGFQIITTCRWLQGDKERAAGLPISSLCDRHAVDVGSSQLSFLQHVVRPAFEALQPLAPTTAAAALRCIQTAQVCIELNSMARIASTWQYITLNADRSRTTFIL